MKKLKGRNVKKYVKEYYKHHKHKQAPEYIAGAVACRIREEHGRSCSPRGRRRRR